MDNSIVEKFTSALRNEIGSQNTLEIAISDYSTLTLKEAKMRAIGFEWSDSLPVKSRFDYIVANLPLGMNREMIRMGKIDISVRKNWGELFKALQFLSDDGECLALIEPPAFGVAEGPKFEDALNSEGYYLNGIFNTPNDFIESSSIRPVLVAISRSKKEQIFVAELTGVEQAEKVAHSFKSEVIGNSINEGIFISLRKFTGFTRLKAEEQIDRLNTQYKEYDIFRLNDISVEINTVKAGERHKLKANSIYIPILGISNVTHALEKVTIKHHNVFQVVLSENTNNEYLSAFFQSELGKLILNSLAVGVVTPKIRKSDLADIKVALPAIDEQREIVSTQNRLIELKLAINDFHRELALNPRSAMVIKLQLESMLEQIGGLSETDKIMSLARSGESKTVEFKESFSLDLRKGTKEKYIEKSALKNIVAFLNTNGGILLIGVSDAGHINGIRNEVQKFHLNNDKFLLCVKNQIKERIGEQYYPFIDQKLVNVLGNDVLMIECKAAASPCYLDGNEFYVRTNPATDKLDGPKLVEYVRNHFKN